MRNEQEVDKKPAETEEITWKLIKSDGLSSMHMEWIVMDILNFVSVFP